MGKKQSRNVERGAGERGQLSSVCRKLKLARAGDAAHFKLSRWVWEGAVYAYTCMGRRMVGVVGWLDGMGTTTTTAGVDGTWTAHTFVMLDCAENQLQQQWQQQESGRTQLAKSCIWYTRIVSTLVGTTYQDIDVCVRCATTCTRIYRNRLLE